MEELKFSDFENETQKGKLKCKDCIHCINTQNGYEYAKCDGIPNPNDERTGFKNESSYISILIGYDDFPNKDGDCKFYELLPIKSITKKKWWRIWK